VTRPPETLESWNERGVGKFPAYLGIVFTQVSPAEVIGEFAIKSIHMAPNGFLHAGSIVTLADTSCGYGCLASLPESATGFTTLELKSNHRDAPAPGKDHAGLGCRGESQGERKDSRDVSVYPTGAVPEMRGVST
jgi:acyl-coenzyme A thioesterase PaaI-like protein